MELPAWKESAEKILILKKFKFSTAKHSLDSGKESWIKFIREKERERRMPQKRKCEESYSQSSNVRSSSLKLNCHSQKEAHLLILQDFTTLTSGA